MIFVLIFILNINKYIFIFILLPFRGKTIQFIPLIKTTCCEDLPLVATNYGKN